MFRTLVHQVWYQLKQGAFVRRDKPVEEDVCTQKDISEVLPASKYDLMCQET